MEKQSKTAHRNPLKIGDLESKIPLIQGGMGVGISLGNLAGAVAKAGGVGIISAAQIGYREPDFENNTVEANLRAIEKEYDKARKISPKGVIGFNIMVAMNHYKEYVKKVAEVGADLIISGAGLPTELPELVAGYDVKIAPIVSGEKAAQVFGQIKTNDVAPKIVNDRTMLPARFVAENLGADVSWDGEKELVTITGKNLKTDENVTILITIGSATVKVNGKEIKLDSPAFIENDRTYTPIRFISEELGASVEWVEKDKKVIITKPEIKKAETK